MKQPKCRDCGQSIAWFNILGVGRRPFEPKPVDQASTGRPAYPVEGGALAWSLRDLVEDLMVRREISHDEADDEARAMPFYVRHTCAQTPPTVSADEDTPSPDLDETWRRP